MESQLAEVITPRGPAVVEDAQHATDAVFELRPITRQEIINTVNNLKGGTAPGCDLIPAKFIKSSIEYLVDPLQLTPYNKPKYLKR